MSREIRGDLLRPSARADALRKFVHRMTTEAQQAHPEFADYMKQHGWRLREQTDSERLHTTYFKTNKNGSLDCRVSSCRRGAEACL